MTPFDELSQARRRWRRKHEELGLPDHSGRQDAHPAGLALRVKDLSMRLVILPRDPVSSKLTFEDDVWGWWTNQSPAPFEGSGLWNELVPTVNAAVKVRGSRKSWGHLPRRSPARWR